MTSPLTDERLAELERCSFVTRCSIAEVRGMASELIRLRKACDFAAEWFDDYERQHTAKGTDDGDRKARTNANRAAFLRAARQGGET